MCALTNLSNEQVMLIAVMSILIAVGIASIVNNWIRP